MSLTAKHIAILVDNYFEQAEFEVPLKFLKDEGVDVTVVSSAKIDLQAMEHVKLADKFRADELLDDTDIDSFDALVIPGGVINADNLRMVPKAREWVSNFIDNGKLIAAICHAPWLLVSADELEGRRLTSWPTLQDDIRNAGGEWIYQPVVVDDNLITSRKPGDLDGFNDAIKEWFNNLPEKSESLASLYSDI
jgi:protease I